MLEDWEKRELLAIEQQLGRDDELARILSGPTDHQVRWLVVHRYFYPVGYLACALAYMLLAIGGGRLGTAVGVVLTAVTAWVVGTLRSVGRAAFAGSNARGVDR